MSKKILTISTIEELKQVLSYAAAKMQENTGYSVVFRIEPLLENIHGIKIKSTKDALKKQNKFLGGSKPPFGTKIDEKTNELQKIQNADEIFNLIKTMRQQRSSYKTISQILKDKYNISISHEGLRKLFISGRI